MRISSVRISRFGGVRDMAVDLSPGVNVVVGDNESGKSSLCEFMRSTMIPPSGRGRRYPDDPDAEGLMQVISDPGEEIRLVRRGRRVRVEGGPDPVALSGGMDLGTYERVFAIDLEGMSGADLLQEENVRGRMLSNSAGIAASALPEALSLLTKRSEAVAKYRSGKRLIDERLGTLEGIRRRKRELQDSLSAYSDVVKELDESEEELEGLRGSIGRSRASITSMERLLSARETWMELGAIEGRIEPLLPSSSLGEDLERRLEELCSTREGEERRTGELRAKVRVLEEGIEAARGDVLDEEVERSIRAALESRHRLESLEGRLPSLREELRATREAVDRGLSRLGRDWDAGRVLATDTSLQGQEFLDRAKGEGEALRERLIALRTTERELSAGREVPLPPREEVDTARLEREISALARMRPHMVRVEGVPTTPSWPVPSLVTLPAAAYLAITGDLLPAALMALAGLGASMYMLLASRGGGNVDREGRIAAIARDAGMEAPADIVALEALSAELVARRERARARAEIDRRLGSLQGEREDRERRLKETRSAIEDAETGMASLKERVDAWSVTRGMPSGIGPDMVRSLIQGLNALKEDLARAGELERRLEDGEEEMASLVAKAEEAATGLFEPDGWQATLNRLGEALSRSERARERRRLLQEDLGELRGELGAAEEALSGIDGAMAEMLQASGCHDLEGLRTLAGQRTELETLRRRRAEKEEALVRIAGGTGGLEGLRDELVDLDFDELASRLEEEREGLRAKEESRDACIERRRELELRKGAMETDRRLSEEIAAEGRVRAEIEELTQAWARAVLARHLIQEAQRVFERERQPKVIRNADLLLREMTAGRYRLFHSPPEGVLLEEDAVRKGDRQWSSGLADQVHLSLRLGLAMEFATDREMLPLVLDDVLVRFDPSRVRGAARAIAKVGETAQVVLLSCRPGVVDAFEGTGARVISLGD